MKKIVLLGYMGCGKSTIAQKLSGMVSIPYVDLDEYIEKKEKMSIKQIFENYGEVHFRKLERTYLLELLNSPEENIIGLGGGTPCYSNNHELLIADGVTSIYLKASIDTLFKRLASNKSKRPLIADKNDEEMKEFIAKHLFERSPYYNYAQHKVNVDGKTIEETVNDILNLLS